MKLVSRRLFGFVAGVIVVAGLATGASAAVVASGTEGDLGLLSVGDIGSFSHITTDNAQFSAPLSGVGEVIMLQLNAAANLATVSAVPLPPAVWLFLSALIGLVGVVRRKRPLTREASPRGHSTRPSGPLADQFWRVGPLGRVVPGGGQ